MTAFGFESTAAEVIQGIDLKGKRGRFTTTTSVPGQQGVKIEEIVDGLVLYMHSDALAKGLPDGKSWLKLDLKAAGAKQGVDIAQLQSLSGGGDPTQFLSYLAKAGDVHKAGKGRYWVEPSNPHNNDNADNEVDE